MKLMIKNDVVEVMLGEAVFFGMDTTHSGYSYNVYYFRFFIKFGYKEISKKHDEISSILTCKFCHFSTDKINSLRSHIRFCSENLKGEKNCKRKAKIRKIGNY